MKKLQLKKEVIQKLDNDRQVIIKGGTDTIYGDSGGTNCHTCKQVYCQETKPPTTCIDNLCVATGGSLCECRPPQQGTEQVPCITLDTQQDEGCQWSLNNECLPVVSAASVCMPCTTRACP